MIRLGIVGAGVMGTNHARVAKGLRDVEVTAIVDSDHGRVTALASSVGATPFSSLDDAFGAMDAAVLAVPTPLHGKMGIELVRRGVSVLVEKPFVADVEEGAALIQQAASAGVSLMVGHTERFNPVVLELDRLLEEVVHIESSRISPYVSRVQDGVVMDLMIHDLDIVASIAKSEVAQISSFCRTLHGQSEDLACALIGFENGITATLTASRIGQNKIRTTEITQRDNYLTLDLLKQDVTVTRVEHSEFLSDQGTRYKQTGVVEIPFVESRGEPLALQLEHFVSCCITGRPPRVPGQDGLRAVRLAGEVIAASRAMNASLI